MPEITAIILSGAGRYSDPWHPFPETSERIAQVASGLGIVASVVPTTPDGMADALESTPGLLIVDAGGGNAVTGPDPDWARAAAALETVLEAGVPLLGVHAAANAFTDVPAYREALGGRWVNGTSFHPPRGPATFSPASAHPITAQVDAVVVTDDERYSALEIDGDVHPLLAHTHDGVTHVAAWAREDSRGRTVYDGLGHYGPSYDAPARQDLLRREISWLLQR